MRSKWRLFLFIGLMLLLASLVIGCSAKPAKRSSPLFPANLSIMVSPPGAGIVSSMVSPTGAGVVSADVERRMLTIVPPEGNVYERNTPLMLTATPAKGFTFAYWGGDRFSYWNSNDPSDVSSPKTWWLIMNYHKTIIAQFTEVSSPISEVTVSAVTESEADIRWATPEGISQIEYGPSRAYGKIGGRSEGAKDHRDKLIKLEPKTLYHFRIRFVSKDGAEFLSNDYVFTTRKIEDLVSAVLYPVRTVSSKGIVTHFGSTLFNDSSQTITVYKMEIHDESRNRAYLISHDESMGTTIEETWGNGEVPSRKYLSMNGWVNPPFRNEDIVEWQVEWYLEAANGERFTITGALSSFVDFFNWVTK